MFHLQISIFLNGFSSLADKMTNEYKAITKIQKSVYYDIPEVDCHGNPKTIQNSNKCTLPSLNIISIISYKSIPSIIACLFKINFSDEAF